MSAYTYKMTAQQPSGSAIPVGDSVVFVVELVPNVGTEPTLDSDLKIFFTTRKPSAREASYLAGMFSCDLPDAQVRILDSNDHSITIPAGGPYVLPFHILWTAEEPATTGVFFVTHNGGGSEFQAGGDPSPFTYTVIG